MDELVDLLGAHEVLAGTSSSEGNGDLSEIICLLNF
jgi:hypothetical protein